MYCVLRDGRGRIEDLLPLSLRHHSFGDFSHDWQCVVAWHQTGLAYYPKLVTGVPFTPSTGPPLRCRRPVGLAPVGLARYLL